MSILWLLHSVPERNGSDRGQSLLYLSRTTQRRGCDPAASGRGYRLLKVTSRHCRGPASRYSFARLLNDTCSYRYTIPLAYITQVRYSYHSHSRATSLDVRHGLWSRNRLRYCVQWGQPLVESHSYYIVKAVQDTYHDQSKLKR